VKLVLLSLLLFSTLLQATKIHLAVAANLAFVVPELKKSFEILHPKITIKTTLASSGVLTAQIKHGARYGLFLSANMKYPQYLYEEGLAFDKPKSYAQGALALFSTKKLHCDENLHCLKFKNIRKIALGNPKTAPYGKAAIEALKNALLYENVKKKLVFAESVSQTLSYALKATDIGIVASSLFYTPKMKVYKKNIHWIPINTSLYEPIEQGMILLKIKKDKDAYRLFYQFLQSSQAKNIFKRFGYKVL